MVAGEANPHPIQLLVNYWDIRPGSMGARLDEWIGRGVTRLTTFVPWQAVESDISHSLARFLIAGAERRMELTLIVTPEVGVHYPSSGLPREILKKSDGWARTPSGAEIPVMVPPNAIALPSLSSPEFSKRYHAFLTRLDSALADLARTQPTVLDRVTLALTGSFWKYYRSAQQASGSAFAGVAGDYSGSASVVFRQRIEQFYGQREFADAGPVVAQRWKARALEEVNRRWFFQQGEDVFRMRSTQSVQRRAAGVGMTQVELFCPEADPGFTYSSVLQLATGAPVDFHRLSRLIDDMASRVGHAGPRAVPGRVHWTRAGAFRSLSDSEKQFLLLKSLLSFGPRGGGVLVDADEWFGLSPAFRAKAEVLARWMSEGRLRASPNAVYLAPHLWSSYGTLWEELLAATGGAVDGGASLMASVDAAVGTTGVSLLIVDPAMVMTQDGVEKLLRWASSGGLLALPRGPLYSDAARGIIDLAVEEAPALEIQLGISYRLHRVGDGKLVLFDLPEGLNVQGEALSAWRRFISGMLSVAGYRQPCRSSDGRLQLVSLRRRGGGDGLFILNPTSRAVTADLIFPCDVVVGDLAEAIATGPASKIPSTHRYQLEVPPKGVLPVHVEGLERDRDEGRSASLSAEVLRRTASEAAESELPGLDGETPEAVWN